MSQYDFGNLESPLSGADLIDTHLEPWRNALHTSHSGSSRPSYASAGMIWVNNSTTPYVVNYFDGSNDTPFMSVDPSTTGINFTSVDSVKANTSDGFQILGSNGDLVASMGLGTGGNRVSFFTDDVTSSWAGTASMQVLGANIPFSLYRYTTSGTGVGIDFMFERSDTTGGAPNNGDSISQMYASCKNTSGAWREAGRIYMQIIDDPGTTNVESRWVFRTSTVASGASTAFSIRPTGIDPGTDNDKTCGSSTYRWSVVYAGTGSINTSDEREKQDIEDILDDALIAVCDRIKWKKFRFKDAVSSKGAGARIHFGVIAQEVKAAFEAEGLDPFRYGVMCYDEWNEQPQILGDNGEVVQEAINAGNRYGIRYDELTSLYMAYLTHKITC